MSVQELVDREEDRSIRIYQLWQGWAQKYALADLEQHVRREDATRGKLRPRFGRVALGTASAVVAVAFALTSALYVIALWWLNR